MTVAVPAPSFTVYVAVLNATVCSAPQKLDSGLRQPILFSKGAQHESPSSVQSRIQGACGARSSQRCEARGRDLARASTQPGSVLEMESAVCAGRRPRLP